MELGLCPSNARCARVKPNAVEVDQEFALNVRNVPHSTAASGPGMLIDLDFIQPTRVLVY